VARAGASVLCGRRVVTAGRGRAQRPRMARQPATWRPSGPAGSRESEAPVRTGLVRRGAWEKKRSRRRHPFPTRPARSPGRWAGREWRRADRAHRLPPTLCLVAAGRGRRRASEAERTNKQPRVSLEARHAHPGRPSSGCAGRATGGCPGHLLGSRRERTRGGDPGDAATVARASHTCARPVRRVRPHSAESAQGRAGASPASCGPPPGRTGRPGRRRTACGWRAGRRGAPRTPARRPGGLPGHGDSQYPSCWPAVADRGDEAGRASTWVEALSPPGFAAGSVHVVSRQRPRPVGDRLPACGWPQGGDVTLGKSHLAAEVAAVTARRPGRTPSGVCRR
jgi:hypothetical protein